MLKDQEEFYDLVAQHDEFSTFSPTELDAWWFQLNRVDHFITEYQFQQRTRSRLSHLPTTLFTAEPLSSSLVEESIEPESSQPTLEIQEFSPTNNTYITDVNIRDRHTSLLTSNPTQHVQKQSLDYSLGYSLDLSSPLSTEEDVILKPIKKRKRKKRRKSPKSKQSKSTSSS